MQAGEVIAKRYRIERLIGTGGAAEVYEVTDLQTQKTVALKRAGSNQNTDVAGVLLAREFSALAQLSHPLIIRAYDYGRHEGVPYFTMELLSGQNLRDHPIMDWRDACHVLRDVASALGIVHSRRLVHRDVTTRNVCRVADGHAKLIDFGALTPMGPTRELVGTPPFVPPEALEEQRLDGQGDLFALGAVAYFVLTGRHAYSARTFRELGEAWRIAVNPPSAIAHDVPPALDELVLSLVSLVKTARPRNAAEVFQRLTAIADLPPVEGPDVARAYLATPSLVGREWALGRAHKFLDRLRGGTGSALLVEGERGLGRTRLLGAVLLEAKLRGFSTVRASGKDSDGKPFQVMKTLLDELSAVDRTPPGDAEDAAFIEALSSIPRPEDADLEGYATRIAAIFTAAATKSPLVLAVDDVDSADDASLSALAVLSQRTPESPLHIVLSAGRERRPAMRELARGMNRLVLQPLSAPDTRALVSSLFGDVAQVDGLAGWMHRLTRGNARESLELAQHLVDRGVATYQEGSWVLPQSLEGLGLPETMDQALDARISSVTSEARELMQTLSLMSEHEPLHVAEYAALADDGNLLRLFQALNELVVAAILVSAGSAYVFAHQELARVARRSIPEARLPLLHRRLADAYASGAAADPVPLTHHLYHAGEHAAAFRAAVLAVTQRVDQHARGSGLVRSREGANLTERLFLWGIESRMPRKDLVLLGRNLLQLASVVNVELARHADLVLEPLRRESGLVHYDDLSAISDPTERMQACLVRAVAEFESTKESERGLSPLQAVAEVATSAGSLVGVYTREFDAVGTVKLLQLLQPLAALSPAVDVVARLVDQAAKALRGHITRDQRLRMVETLSAPVAGLDDLSREGIRLVCLYYLALEEASSGHQGAADRVAPLDGYPHFAPLAWQVRMLVHLFRGENESATLARRKRDAAVIGRGDVDRHLDVSVIFEASAYSMLGDLLALRRSLQVIAERAKTSPGWEPYNHLFMASYHALRGEMVRALEEYEKAFALVPVPGLHGAWGTTVNGLATTLIDLGRARDAEEVLTKALGQAESGPLLPHVTAQLEMSLALAEASLGEEETASRRARLAVERMLSSGTTGVMLVDHYSKQALVALRTGDHATFNAAESTIEALARQSDSPAFVAKREYLLRQARATKTFSDSAYPPGDIVTRKESHATMALEIRSELGNCRSREERAARVLALLHEWSNTELGFLYLCEAAGLALVGSSTSFPPPESLELALTTWARTLISGDPITPLGSPVQSLADDPATFEPVGLVAHREEGAVLAAVAALNRSPHARSVPQSVLDALGESLLAAGDTTGRPI